MPNRFGVYDMTGNVKEWCADRYGADYYGTSPAENPAGPRLGGERVVRGGGFQQDRKGLKVAVRDRLDPGLKAKDVGFRVVLDTARSVPVKEYIELPLETGGGP
jgi:formylglycine-generating enzyme required for sulfatase activity